MRQFGEDYPSPGDVQLCDCGCRVFYDPRIYVITTQDIGKSPRTKHYTFEHRVLICTKCLQPMVLIDGNAYNVSEHLSTDDIQHILTQIAEPQRQRQQRHRTPEAQATATE